MGDDKNGDKPACKYGEDCYRQNQEHKDRFSHPPKGQPSNGDGSDDGRSSSPQPPETKKRKPSPLSSSDNEEAETVESNKCETGEQKILDKTKNGANGNSSKKIVAVVGEDREKQSTSSESIGARCSEFIYENFDKGPHAQRAEYQKLLDSPADFISSKFLVKMPSDFFSFWEFCESQAKVNSKPENVFNKFGINLVGPFDVVAKKFHNVGPFEPGEYLRHWRFYYDPPEFQVSFSPISANRIRSFELLRKFYLHLI